MKIDFHIYFWYKMSISVYYKNIFAELFDELHALKNELKIVPVGHSL